MDMSEQGIREFSASYGLSTVNLGLLVLAITYFLIRRSRSNSLPLVVQALLLIIHPFWRINPRDTLEARKLMILSSLDFIAMVIPMLYSVFQKKRIKQSEFDDGDYPRQKK